MCGPCIGTYWRASFALAVVCPEGPFTSIKVRICSGRCAMGDRKQGVSLLRCHILRISNALLVMIRQWSSTHTPHNAPPKQIHVVLIIWAAGDQESRCALRFLFAGIKSFPQIFSPKNEDNWSLDKLMRNLDIWTSLVTYSITIFWGDVRLSTTAALDEKLRSVCQATKTPVTATRYHWTLVSSVLIHIIWTHAIFHSTHLHFRSLFRRQFVRWASMSSAQHEP